MQAARDTAASRDALIELFDKIESFFIRLQTYTEVPPTLAMTNVMGKIMAEVLCMLAIATKEMKQRRSSGFISEPELPLTYIRKETFLKKLVGGTISRTHYRNWRNWSRGSSVQ
jgi:predicted alpha/beta hydrolase